MMLVAMLGLALAFAGSANADVFSSMPTPPGGTPTTELDEYTLDDGTGENSIGLTAGGQMVWANKFQVLAGCENVTEIAVAWGQCAAGIAGTALIFDDPNNDGNPADVGPGSVLVSVPTVTDGDNNDTFDRYPIASTNVGAAGDFFYVAICLNHPAGQFPGRIDQTASQGKSYITGSPGAPGACDNPNVMALGVLTVIDTYGLPGNWMVRASCEQGIPVQEASWGTVKATYN
jgi:hypothetical protein